MAKVSKEPRACKFCGKMFIPRSNNQWYCKNLHTRQCPICGKTYVEDNVENLKRPPVACSYDCRKILREQTSLKKYGRKDPGNTKEARMKSIQTTRKHLGVDYPLESKEVREKAKQTLLAKYGVENIANLQSTIDKRKKTNREKYGDTMPFNSEETRKKQQAVMMERYGVPYYIFTEEFKSNCHPTKISKINRQFCELLEKQGYHVEFEYRIHDKFYDLHILDTNILIEIDPTYTHNVIGNHWSQVGLDKYYHRDKSKIAKEAGFRCIHVFDWDSWDKVIDIIKPKQTIGARKCKIYKLNSKTTDEFLNKYHLQGTCKGQVLSLGLVYEDKLLEIMTFGKSRYNKNYDIELLRLCTHPDYVVTGGASKLFKFAVQQYELNSIISYCDASKFSGSVYTNIGMKFLRNTPPQEIWSDCNYGKITANLLRQRGFDQLFGTNYGKGTDNNELMIEHGWLPVYDCGQKVFVYEA